MQSVSQGSCEVTKITNAMHFLRRVNANHGGEKFGRRTAPTPHAPFIIHDTQFNRKQESEKYPQPPALKALKEPNNP